MNLLGICLGVAAFSTSACALDARGLRAEGAFDRTLSVSESVELEVHTASGRIRIQTGDPGVVRVRGRVRCANLWTGLDAEGCVRRIEAAPPIDRSGNMIRLGAFDRHWLWGGVRIDFDITDTQWGWGKRPLKTPQHCFDPRYQFARAERLGNVIIGSQL